MPPPRPIVSTEPTAITHSRMTAPATAKYSSLIGISSLPLPPATLAAFCIDLMALMINGAARMTPMMAPPISMPMPNGRYSITRSESGSLIAWPAASTGKLPVMDSIGEINQ